jgi:hypothetical protein
MNKSIRKALEIYRDYLIDDIEWAKHQPKHWTGEPLKALEEELAYIQRYLLTKEYAKVAWTPKDLGEYSVCQNWTYEEKCKFLGENASYIRDAMIEAGLIAIEDVLPEEVIRGEITSVTQKP